jgi:hypothetical protein
MKLRTRIFQMWCNYVGHRWAEWMPTPLGRLVESRSCTRCQAVRTRRRGLV